ncbi:MAG: hypothetical protein JAZ17_05575 [Candidatus Thiodiazotropha endolucinida]|nr:hypothetical protein [Candidatus Thiodiazotropha endolucinida]
MIPNTIVNSFSEKNSISIEEASIIFSRLEAYFNDVASGSNKAPEPHLDEAWHHFILDTKNYENYCIENYGAFIHHVPDYETFKCRGAIGKCKPDIR